MLAKLLRTTTTPTIRPALGTLNALSLIQPRFQAKHQRTLETPLLTGHLIALQSLQRTPLANS
ncbi:MAG TPA: hypothetical protein VNW25_07005, partial [Candidatus Sulfotelmatobacter sp.]|nr:hypothetical protein [Candidatus Sulfotelmatobacter sp.]